MTLTLEQEERVLRRYEFLKIGEMANYTADGLAEHVEMLRDYERRLGKKPLSSDDFINRSRELLLECALAVLQEMQTARTSRRAAVDRTARHAQHS